MGINKNGHDQGKLTGDGSLKHGIFVILERHILINSMCLGPKHELKNKKELLEAKKWAIAIREHFSGEIFRSGEKKKGKMEGNHRFEGEKKKYARPRSRAHYRSGAIRSARFLAGRQFHEGQKL